MGTSDEVEPGPAVGPTGRRAHRSSDRIRSLGSAALAGIAFGVLSFVGVSLLDEYPSLDQSEEELTAWFDDFENRATLLTGLNLVAISIVAFLWFMAVIRRQLGDREDRFFATVFLGSGLVVSAVFGLAAAALAAPAVAMTTLGAGSVDGASVSLAAGLGRGLTLVVGPRLQAVFVLSMSSIVLRSGILPRWLAFVGFLLGATMLIMPIVARPIGLAFSAWVFVVSVVVLWQQWRGVKPVAAG